MDQAGHVLLTAAQLYARAENTTSSNSTSSTHPTETKPASYKVVGLVLALVSGLFIGVSFVLKKVGLLKANAKYNQEAGEGYGYLKNWHWWGGMTLMILGEICNFAAYLFADAILVTPLGALSVVVTAILSAIFLKERLSFVGKMGCFSCIVGATVIAINAPEQSAVTTIQEMKKLVVAPGFLVYMCVIIAGSAFIALWLGPRYGKKSMMVYLSVCSLIGGLSVSGIQGIGAAITAQARGIPQWNYWFTYVLLIFIIITLVTEVIYLNKALNLYNAAIVTPTYYVFFTSAVIVTSAVLFQGFKGTAIQIITVVLGFLQVCTGVVLLQLSKSAKDVPDTAVFSGDVDQIRVIAQQEEPEYEPRADTIRGGGAILRSISRARASRQMAEVEKLREEHLHPIGENEEVEFDGVRRRRTISGSTASGSRIQRRKTVHPPLGMSHFPEPEDDNDSDYHPGIFHFRRKHRSDAASHRSSGTAATAGPAGSSVPMSPLKPSAGATDEIRPVDSRGSDVAHIYGLPPGLQRFEPGAADTSYRGSTAGSSFGPGHIHFADDVDDRPSSRGTPAGQGGGFNVPPSAAFAREPAKRQFSFTNVFSRSRPSSAAGGANPAAAAEEGRATASSGPVHPGLGRSGLSFTRKGSHTGRGGRGNDGTTEEERLGLVKGDSANNVVPHVTRSRSGSSDSYAGSDLGLGHGVAERYEDDDWDRLHTDSARESAVITVHQGGNSRGGSTRDLTSSASGASASAAGQRVSAAPKYSIDLGRETRSRGGHVPTDEEEGESERSSYVLPMPKDLQGDGASGRFI